MKFSGNFLSLKFDLIFELFHESFLGAFWELFMFYKFTFYRASKCDFLIKFKTYVESKMNS